MQTCWALHLRVVSTCKHPLGCGIKELPVSRTPWHLLTPYFSPGDKFFFGITSTKKLRVFHPKSWNFYREIPAMQHHFQRPKHGSSHMYQSFCHQWWCHQTGIANNLASGPHDTVSRWFFQAQLDKGNIHPKIFWQPGKYLEAILLSQKLAGGMIICIYLYHYLS